MKKQLFVLLASMLFSFPLMGQVGINTTSPKATLEVNAKNFDGATSEGLLSPRLSGDALHNADLKGVYREAQDGILIFVTAAPSPSNRVGQTLNIDGRGFYYYDYPENRWTKLDVRVPVNEISSNQAFSKGVSEFNKGAFSFLSSAALTKVNQWITKGLNESKLLAAFNKATNKEALVTKLESSKSIYHQRVHIEDWDNIPGIVKSNYVRNGLSSAKTNSSWNNAALDLPAIEAANFVDATAVELQAGTKIYRVTGGAPGGGYWTLQKPGSVGNVIGGTAVQPAWNDFSKMYVYEVPQGQTLKVWVGSTAKQPIEQGVTNPHLPGGEQQIFIPQIIRNDTFQNLIKQTQLPW
ncbi:hypothetical protein [Chryseobacterium fistulae]|uniref:Uncharacterized protein n=1 Tax=Chryseobacterium fistulae TaxID=2675058 RepID=A0A6N4XMH3_9FLAO|nr:hypothetical protein [Chryseobacterium fistulae]CAA7386363.1 hypothetical protein CHRY9393_00656 [Chryseobacterium fistulae]